MSMSEEDLFDSEEDILKSPWEQAPELSILYEANFLKVYTCIREAKSLAQISTTTKSRLGAGWSTCKDSSFDNGVPFQQPRQ